MMDDSDCLVECPYNKSHRVQKSRLQTHLFKCRKVSQKQAQLSKSKKNYPGCELKRCPFNANHDIPVAEWGHHVEVCCDRGTVETHLAQTVQERTPVIMPYVAPVLPDEAENWDCDEPVQTYDPSAKNSGCKVLRGLQGATKSERKIHRAKERLLFNAVAEHGGVCTASGGKPMTKNVPRNEEPIEEPIEDKPAYDYNKEVRQPRTASKTFVMRPDEGPSKIPLKRPDTPPKTPETPPRTPGTSPTSLLNSVQAPAPDWGLPRGDTPRSMTPQSSPASRLNSVQAPAPDWGLPRGEMSRSRIPEGIPPNLAAWGSTGLPVAGRAMSFGPEQSAVVQAPQRAPNAWARPVDQPQPAADYKNVLSVDTGVGVPPPNLEFPALKASGRGRGKNLRNSRND